MVGDGAKSLLDSAIGVGDAVLIDPLSEDSFLENLQIRFQHDKIYVSILCSYFLLQSNADSFW